MTSEEIEALRAALFDNARVCWVPDAETCCPVTGIGRHPEEDEDAQCAYLSRGHYVALDNCELRDFAVLTPIILG